MLMSFRRRDKRADDAPQAEKSSGGSEKAKLRPRRKSTAQSTAKLLLLLVAVWLATIHYFERVRVKHALDACQWDKWENWTGDKAGVTPHRVVLLADPQLVDDHTYPKIPRWINYFLRRASDNYLYINHKYMQAHLDPDTTIFVGDLFDGGRDWDDKVWIDEYERFNRIFPRKPNRRSYRSLPGNHDIGFQNISAHNQRRFAAFFGDANDAWELGNHTFVQLDTISMSHEDPEINQELQAFFGSVEKLINPMLPRIVLSHVPLYRDPKVEVCGPEREAKRPFPLQRGFQYQTVIEYPITKQILDKLNPSLIFSGDDHDVCDMVHLDYQDNTKKLAREISCKTPSMTNGIKYPAYHLLSLNNPYDPRPKSTLLDPNEAKTYETMMCYLPNPYRGLKVYGILLMVLFAILFACIVYPETVDDVFGHTKPNLLPHSFQTFVNHDNENNIAARRLSCFAHCSVLLTCILIMLSLYNRM